MTSHTRLILIRHGEVESHWRERIYGDLDVPLSENGKDQSRAVAERLRERELAAVVSSGLARAEFIAKLLRTDRPHLERRDDARLREIDRGRWAGKGQAQVEAETPGGWERWRAARGALGAPGGETLEAMRPRVLAGLDDTAELDPGLTVAIVAHTWVLRQAACASLELALASSPDLEVPYTGVLEVDWPTAAGRDGGATPRFLYLDGHTT
ncbi:MAG: histidine phosphatase family protein [bacterium]|nr:histidine phosphatase family protein [bacterium]